MVIGIDKLVSKVEEALSSVKKELNACMYIYACI